MRPHVEGLHPRAIPAPYDWPVEGDMVPKVFLSEQFEAN